MPSERATFQVTYAASLELAEAASMPALLQRLTAVPVAWRETKFLSRSSFISWAMRPSAKSHDTRLKVPAPGPRYIGYFRRVGACTTSRSPDPFGHRVPR